MKDETVEAVFKWLPRVGTVIALGAAVGVGMYWGLLRGIGVFLGIQGALLVAVSVSPTDQYPFKEPEAWFTAKSGTPAAFTPALLWIGVCGIAASMILAAVPGPEVAQVGTTPTPVPVAGGSGSVWAVLVAAALTGAIAYVVDRRSRRMDVAIAFTGWAGKLSLLMSQMSEEVHALSLIETLSEQDQLSYSDEVRRRKSLIHAHGDNATALLNFNPLLTKVEVVYGIRGTEAIQFSLYAHVVHGAVDGLARDMGCRTLTSSQRLRSLNANLSNWVTPARNGLRERFVRRATIPDILLSLYGDLIAVLRNPRERLRV